MKPFKKQKLECEKCGNYSDIHIKYCVNSKWQCREECSYGKYARTAEIMEYYYADSILKEHLHYYCRDCSYDWIEPVRKKVSIKPHPPSWTTTKSFHINSI